MKNNEQILILEDNTVLTQVPEFPDYYCDIENGILYTTRTGEKIKRMKGHERPGKHNYVTVTLMTDREGKYRCMGLHEICVAAREQSWDWKRLHRLEVDHSNQRKNDNRGENLELTDHKGQYSESIRMKIGEQIRRANRVNLNEEDVIEIRQRFHQWDGYKSEFASIVAEEFGVSVYSIYALLRGHTWTHV